MPPQILKASLVGAGLDAIDVSAATERGIVVCNGAGLNAQATAELAFSSYCQ